jgi:hypothetical protein
VVADGSAGERPRVLISLKRNIVGGGRQRRRRLVKLCLVPGVGFADAVVARIGIFSMLADGSSAGRPRVLSGLRRTIVGGGRQRRRRLVKLCLVPGVEFADAVVARIGIFSMLAAGSGAGRPRVLSSLRRDIVGGGRQRRRRLIKLCLVAGMGFADAVVARVGIFSMLAAGGSAGRSRVLSSLRRDIVGGGRQRRRRLIKLCLVPGVGFADAVVARIGIFSMLAAGSGAGRPRVLSSLRRDIVGGGRQRRRRLTKLCLVPGMGFADAVVARVGLFSMVADGGSAGRPRVLSSLRRTIVGGG